MCIYIHIYIYIYQLLPRARVETTLEGPSTTYFHSIFVPVATPASSPSHTWYRNEYVHIYAPTQ